MPSVRRFGGLRVVVYPNDHPPAHVHVIGHGYEAVFQPNCAIGAVVLRKNYGFARRDIAEIRRTLDDNVPALCIEWETFHGPG